MILSGVILMCFGWLLYYLGNTVNNDLDAQLESIFNDGFSDPGSAYETWGILLLIAGFTLLIVGVIRNRNQQEEVPPTGNQSQAYPAVSADMKKRPLCSKCGVVMPEGSKFCMNCGATVAEIRTDMFCPNCGQKLPKDSKFCIECGREIKTADKINAALNE